MIDLENEQPKIRHRDKLESLRSKANERPRIISDRGSDASGIEKDGSSIRTGEGFDSIDTSGEGRVSIGEERTEAVEGTIRGSDNGIRSSISEISNDNSSSGKNTSETESPRIIERDLQAEKERKRELARQRKARQREREAQAQSTSKTTSDSDTREPFVPENLEIKIKNVTSKKPVEEIKLFTKLEADEKLEKLTYIVQQGTSLIDDLVEIIVKDHEKVNIWKFDDNESVMVATMMLESAKKDKAIAKQVRTIIAVYDKMYLAMLVGPRVLQTTKHIKKHGGLSIR
jgi:hypothetical protein